MERHSKYLEENGVLIIRCHQGKVAEDLIKLIGRSFEIMVTHSADALGPVIVVFRPYSARGGKPSAKLI
jgi:hypothetical protein